MITNYSHPLYKTLLCLGLSLLLSACGFHLRGSQNLPPQLKQIYIESTQPYAPFEQALRAALQSSNIQVVNAPNKEAFILKITKKSLSTTLISLSLSTQVTQYNLVYAVTYELIDPKGRIIIPTETLSSANTYAVNTNQMLGASNQQDQLTDTLRSNTIFLLLDRLSSNKVRLAFEKNSPSHA